MSQHSQMTFGPKTAKNFGCTGGEHPMAGGWLSRHVHGMKPKQFLPNAIQTPAQEQGPTARADLNQGQPVAASAPEAAAPPEGAKNKKQSAPPGKEAREWLEGEAQLFGGVERESQMHPGSSLFISER